MREGMHNHIGFKSVRSTSHSGRLFFRRAILNCLKERKIKRNIFSAPTPELESGGIVQCWDVDYTKMAAFCCKIISN